MEPQFHVTQLKTQDPPAQRAAGGIAVVFILGGRGGGSARGGFQGSALAAEAIRLQTAALA
jgi:hypothetical protein